MATSTDRTTSLSLVGLLRNTTIGLAVRVCLAVWYFIGPWRSLNAALEPTELHCASVAPDGSVTITWTPPADPLSEFANYRIYSATALVGPYALIGTDATITTNAFPDPLGDARSGPIFYYVTTVTGGASPEESAPSDTIATIFLQVFQSAPPGNADLSWNALAVSTTAQDSFSVWMEYPIGTLEELATVSDNVFAYQHEISICEDSLTFHVRRLDERGCFSISNWDGDVFRDVTPPTPPSIVAVGVDTVSGLASLEWEPSPELDTDGYIILFDAPGGAVIIDTVFGRTTISYEWSESLAGSGPESYSVAAFDTCLTGSPPSPNTSPARPFHTTIHLALTYDECAGTVQLDWTPYEGWVTSEHRIYRRQVPGIWSLIGTTDGGTFTFTDEVDPYITYCYAVEAFSDAGTPVGSLSNSACVTTDYPGRPLFNYIRTVTVTGLAEITIVDSVDAAALVNGYRLERSEDGGEFMPIATQGPSALSVIVFVDPDVEPSSVSYQYRIVVEDACGVDALISNVGGNIILRVTPDLTGLNTLEWNGYQEWAGVVQAYFIQRQVAEGPMSPLTITPPSPWLYVDDVSSLTTTTGRFCYLVEAIESGDPSGINMTSRSNLACAVQEELVFIPNAFILGGHNPSFKPVLSYADVETYELSIINRWGQVFWTTNDPEMAWDGTAGGRPVPIGVYAYYCSFSNGAGRVFEKRGTVTMLTAEE